MLGFYVHLTNLENKTELLLIGLEEILIKEKTSEEWQLEKEILARQKKIKDFAPLFASHRSAQNFFNLLEENCHPRVWFSGIYLNLQEFELNLSGDAETFQALEQQILIFQGVDDISEVNLSNISIGKDKEINFALDIVLNPGLFDFFNQ